MPPGPRTPRSRRGHDWLPRGRRGRARADGWARRRGLARKPRSATQTRCKGASVRWSCVGSAPEDSSANCDECHSCHVSDVDTVTARKSQEDDVPTVRVESDHSGSSRNRHHRPYPAHAGERSRSHSSSRRGAGLHASRVSTALKGRHGTSQPSVSLGASCSADSGFDCRDRPEWRVPASVTAGHRP
jgi:hypothetical protein